MKKKLSLIAALALVMIYAGCKKSSNAPASTVTDSQVSLQVVQNLVGILSGGFGYDPTSGKIANSLKKTGSHLKVNSTTGDGCSMAYDTTVNISEKIDTISTTMKGEIKLTANCGNGGTNPVITIFENYTLGLATPHISANYKLGANLMFQIADINNNPLFTYDGTVSVDADLNYLLGSKGNSKQSYAYTFHTITVDESGIKGGSADFTTTGSGSTGSWNFKGTVKFLGNDKADIVLGGKTYHVDMATGAVTS